MAGQAIAVNKQTGTTHLSHRAGPNATDYRGHKIHRKGLENKMKKALAKASARGGSASVGKPHEHEGHSHQKSEVEK